MIYSRSPSRRVRGGCDYLSIRICQGNLSRKSPDLHDKLPLQIDVLGSGYQIILQYVLWATSFAEKCTYFGKGFWWFIGVGLWYHREMFTYMSNSLIYHKSTCAVMRYRTANPFLTVLLFHCAVLQTVPMLHNVKLATMAISPCVSDAVAS